MSENNFSLLCIYISFKIWHGHFIFMTNISLGFTFFGIYMFFQDRLNSYLLCIINFYFLLWKNCNAKNNANCVHNQYCFEICFKKLHSKSASPSQDTPGYGLVGLCPALIQLCLKPITLNVDCLFFSSIIIQSGENPFLIKTD